MARGKAQSMPAPRKKGHQNESGKPTNDRGKPPHKGGHRSGSMRKPTFKVGGKAIHYLRHTKNGQLSV